MLTLTSALPSMGATAPNKKDHDLRGSLRRNLFHTALAVVVMAIFGNLAVVGTSQVPNLELAGLFSPVVRTLFMVVIVMAIYTTACPMAWGFCGKIAKGRKIHQVQSVHPGAYNRRYGMLVSFSHCQRSSTSCTAFPDMSEPLFLLE